MAYINGIWKEELLKRLEATRHEPWVDYNTALGIMIAEEVEKQFEEILLPISKVDENNI